MSLARLWQQQGKRKKDTHKLLSDIYAWSTEGFDTKDLQEAKALLDSLGLESRSRVKTNQKERRYAVHTSSIVLFQSGKWDVPGCCPQSWSNAFNRVATALSVTVELTQVVFLRW